MLTKRIIPCLDVKNFRTVKGVNFQNLRDAGDAIKLAEFYSAAGADELVFLDISATIEGRGQFLEFVEKVAEKLSIPFSVGGGISSVSDAEKCFRAGADKVSINSAAVKNKKLISDLAQKFGSQAVILAVDVKIINNKQLTVNHFRENKKWSVFTRGGTFDTKIDAIEWISAGQNLGAGEILLTSMDSDGVKNGFDTELLAAVKNVARVPVIASGGAGKMEHFAEIFENDLADAGLAASIFHFGEIQISDLKKFLKSKKIPVRI